MPRALVPLLLVLLASSASPAAAQIQKLDPFMRTVHAELRKYEKEMGISVLTHDVWSGSLRDDERTTLTVSLDAGVSYVILAVCDEDCSDIDLRLYSGSTLVSEDVQVDDYPVVTVKPSTSHDYRLEAVMASCSSSPCRYGVAIYSR
jgi:hypothetical protein